MTCPILLEIEIYDETIHPGISPVVLLMTRFETQLKVSLSS